MDPLDGTREFLALQRRVHDQCGADRRARAPAAGAGLRAGTRAAVDRRIDSAFACDVASGRRPCRARRARRPIRTRAVRQRRARRRREPYRISDAQSECVPRGGCRSAKRGSRGSSLEVLPARGGSRATSIRASAPTMEWDTAAGEAVLRAARAPCSTPFRTAASLRQGRERPAQRRLHRVGRRERPRSNWKVKIRAPGFAAREPVPERGGPPAAHVNLKPRVFGTDC